MQIQALEVRCLLTASTATATLSALTELLSPRYQLTTAAGATPLASSAPVGLTPAQIRHAYGIDQIIFDGGIVGDGAGQTIAIVDAYHSPTAYADLQVFDATFHIADPPSFRQVAQDGSTNFPPVDPAGAGNADGTWELETALDVEWVHAIAPAAHILLVEATSSSFADLVQAAVNYARNQPGVVAVSMSFGSDEFSGETTYDSYFTTPSGHTGVTFLAATGDDGQPGGYPAYSPNVVAVGGTTLTTNSSGAYLGETGWSGSGGGTSTTETQPGYQTGTVTQSTTRRANPDVAFDADPNSGVAVYDSYDFGVNGWIQIPGSFRPISSLAALNGDGLDGVWTLKIADTVRRDSGTLNSWSLNFTTGSDIAVTTAADGSYKFVDVAPGVHHIREAPQADFAETQPAGGVYNLTVAVGASLKGKDFGNYQAPPPPPPDTVFPAGDFNRDHTLTAADLPAMMVALTDLSAYQTAKSLSDAQLLATGDVNGDGQITNADIQSLIAAIAAAETQTTNSTATSNATTIGAAAPTSSATSSVTVATSTSVATNSIASTATVSDAAAVAPKRTTKTARHHAAVSSKLTSKQTAAIDHALETAFDFRHTARWRSLVDRVSHVNERAGAALRNVDTILDRIIASV